MRDCTQERKTEISSLACQFPRGYGRTLPRAHEREEARYIEEQDTVHTAMLCREIYAQPSIFPTPGIANPIAFNSAASNSLCSVVSSTSGGRSLAHSGSFP